MIALIQRVTSAKVSLHHSASPSHSIGLGLCVFLGVVEEDTQAAAEKIASKLVKLRIFNDKAEKMNLDIRQTGGSILLISQFTLAADLSGGNRPSFIKAAAPDIAASLYNLVISRLQALGVNTQSGFFGEYMDVEIHNDGPVTIIVDSKLL